MINALLGWILTEFLLSALLFSVWRSILAAKFSSSDRYLFLKISFVLLLILPVIQTYVSILAPTSILNSVFSDVTTVSQTGSQVSTVESHSDILNWTPALKLSVVVVYFAALAIQLWQLLSSFFYLRNLCESATFLRFSIDRHAKILVHDKDIPPAVFGFFQPVILLPATLLNRSESDLETVIRHEESHIQNRDHLFNLLKVIVRVILTFSPFVFHLAKRFEEEMELTCDELVLRKVPAKQYGTLLLDLATMGAPCRRTLYSGVFISNSFIARRIQVMKEERLVPKPMRSILFALTFMLLAAPILWATQGRSDQDNQVSAVSGILFKYKLQTKQRDGQSKKEQKLEGTMVVPNQESRRIAGDGLALQVTPSRQGGAVKFDLALFDATNKQLYSGAIIVQDGTDGGIEGRLEEQPYTTEFSFEVDVKKTDD